MTTYKLDVGKNSFSRDYTPGTAARLFPLCMTGHGYYESRPEYFTTRDGKTPTMPLLIFTVAGKGVLTWNGQSCALHPGSAVVFSCDFPHDYRPDGPWAFYFVHLDGSGLDGFRKHLLERLTPVQIYNTKEMVDLFGKLFSIDSRRDILSCMNISQCLFEMLSCMLNSLILAPNEKRSARDDIQRIVEYIHTHVAEPLCLDDFINTAHLSKYYMVRLFKQYMGVPPYHFLQEYRVNKAQVLLCTTSMSIDEISVMVGIPDPNNFIRIFRKITGKTPGKYRKENGIVIKEEQ